MSRETKIALGVGLGLLLVACCCAALVIAGAAGIIIFSSTSGASPLIPPTENVQLDPTLGSIGTELAATLAAPAPTATPTPAPADPGQPTPTPAPAAPKDDDTLAAITSAEIRERDLRQITAELTGQDSVPATTGAGPADHAVGTVLEFRAHNTDTNEPFTVNARLVYKTDNAYFFAEEGVDVNESATRRLLDDFQANTYPTNRAFFGSEWSPGVDGDPRVYILFVRGIGFSTLGYYSSEDQYTRAANPDSNEKEMFYINADLTEPGDADLASTLAHEFQHMIHWNQDLNEDTWLNEGASMLAELLNGYDPVAYASDFADDPDRQLNTWTDGDTIPHYGAAYLFQTYFLDRFGEAASKALVADPRNGLASVDGVLADLGLTDSATGQPLTASDVFADWAVANYLNDPALSDGRYAYRQLTSLPRFETASEYRTCPVGPEPAQVRQYGTDYHLFNCAGSYTLTFTGDSEVAVVPAEARDGRYVWWGHRNDESITTLTRALDLTGLSAATLQYAAWWDIEQDYDYAYLQASTDGGATWQVLRAPGMTDSNPNGSNLGWGYTGRSEGWLEETVDLSAYAGQSLLVRFLYVTDAALNEPGLLVDDIRVPELNLSDDFEAGPGEWEARGFVRMDNTVAQTFVVQLIREGAATTVERLTLDGANTVRLPLEIARGERVTLLVSGTTPFTTVPANYLYALEP